MIKIKWRVADTRWMVGTPSTGWRMFYRPRKNVRGGEIIYANRLHLPDSPWFPHIYKARRFLKEEIFKNVQRTIPFNEIEGNTSISDRTFEYKGNQLLLLSFKETEKMFLDEGKKVQFDDIKKRLLEFLKLNDEIPRLLF